MPKASAPNAPWVAVWLSPQTTDGRARQGQALFRADDVHDALADIVLCRVEGRCRIPRRWSASSLDLDLRDSSFVDHVMPVRPAVVGTLWSATVMRQRPGGAPSRPFGAQTLEGLRRW